MASKCNQCNRASVEGFELCSPHLRTAFELAESDVLEGVQIFKMGTSVVHPNGDFVVDEAFVADLESSWTKLTEDGYRPPVLAEHGRAEDGRIYGKVLRLYSTDDGVFVDLELAAGVKEEWEAGYRENISPSIWKEFTHPHSGEEMRNVLREVSMVSVPHLKNLTQPRMHYSLHESGFILSEQPTQSQEQNMPEDKEEMLEDDMELEKLVQKVVDGALDNMMERVEAMETKLAEYMGEKEDMEEHEDMSETNEFHARLASLEKENARLRVERDLGLSGEALDEMAELSLKSPGAYQLAAKHIGPKKADLSERGFTGSSATRKSKKQVYAECAERGIKPGRATLEYIETNYPHLISE
jgi:hypothetical protein